MVLIQNIKYICLCRLNVYVRWCICWSATNRNAIISDQYQQRHSRIIGFCVMLYKQQNRLVAFAFSTHEPLTMSKGIRWLQSSNKNSYINVYINITKFVLFFLFILIHLSQICLELYEAKKLKGCYRKIYRKKKMFILGYISISRCIKRKKKIKEKRE